ncbi:hypothetical protein AgCh_039122 [Apium graveolens]
MNRTKLPIRERIGNVPQFLIGVDVAVAEHGLSLLTMIDDMSVSRCRLMRSLREENVDLPYDRMELESARKYNPDARQIGAYERIDMQPDVTYMEQPVRVIDQKGTSAYEKGYQTSQSLVVEP